MTNETNEIALREYVDKLFELKDQALNLSSAELSRRLDILNGEAGRLRTMQETYLPREVADSRFEQLLGEVSDLKLYKARMEGMASQTSVIIAYVISTIGILLGIIGLFK